MELAIRGATEADLPVIVDIYNQSIPAGWSTADTKPITVAERVDWFRKFDQTKRPIWVAEVDGQPVATTYLSSFYGGRPAYDATAEVSIYIATAHHRQGLGRRLKQWVIQECPRLGVTTLLKNRQSLATGSISRLATAGSSTIVRVRVQRRSNSRRK